MVLLVADDAQKVDESHIQEQTEPKSTPLVSASKDFVLLPHEYEIVALMNILPSSNDALESIIQKEFSHSKVEFQPLKIGDCIWIARPVTVSNDESLKKTLVLPFLVWTDGRVFQEKIKACGEYGFLQVLLLKEEGTKPIPGSVHVNHNTYRIGKFHYFVKMIKDQQDTFRRLADLTLHLKESFKDKAVRSCERSHLPKCYSIFPKTIPLMTWEEFS